MCGRMTHIRQNDIYARVLSGCAISLASLAGGARLGCKALCMQLTSTTVSSASGQTAVGTEQPVTGEDAFWITYTAEDEAGNVARAFRQVLVVCPVGETICNSSVAGGARACSVEGQCVDESLAAAVSATGVSGVPSSREDAPGVCAGRCNESLHVCCLGGRRNLNK